MASPTTLTWMKFSQGNKCHAKRCTRLAVSNRLCDEHNAYWLTHGFKPEPPKYDEPEVGAAQKARMGIKMARQKADTIGALPMITLSDAQRMLEELHSAKGIAEGVPESHEEATHHLRHELEKLDKAYAEVQQAYAQLAAMCEQRIREFENRTRLEILGEREAPMYSGIPTANPELEQAPAAPVRRIRRVR